jgi:oxygen-dependent protoporphyrinogen oxidase
LRSGLGTLVDRLVAAIPPHWLRPNAAVIAIDPPGSNSADGNAGPRWTLRIAHAGRFASEAFDAVLLAAPLDASRRLLAPLAAAAAQLLPAESSSAVLVAFCYADASHFPVPPGFGFLVPPSEAPARNAGAPQPALSQPKGLDSEMWVPPNSPSLLLACTFADQKFAHRVPPGGRLVRAFFGGAAAERIARCNNDEIAAIARLELARILHTAAPNSAAAVTPALPAVLTPNLPVLTVVRRWPNSLPQYPVGHLERIAELESRLRALPGLTLLGNALNGLGIPDLIRDARAAARLAATN